MPTTIASSAASARMPTSLPVLVWPVLARTSFGHFSRVGTPVTSVIASTTATPVSRGSQPRRAGGTSAGRTSRENVRAARGGVVHVRPIRPRPARWCSVASTMPSGSPRSARASRSALVDPVLSTTSTSRHRPPGRTAAWRSAAGASGARAGVSFSVRIVTNYCSDASRRDNR